MSNSRFDKFLQSASTSPSDSWVTASREEIIELYLHNTPVRDIAARLSVSQDTVRTTIREWLQVSSEALQDLSEITIIRTSQRLEQLYKKTVLYATGEQEGLPPDPALMRVVLKIIEEQRKWVELLEKRNASLRDDDSMAPDLVYTIPTSSALYEEAVAHAPELGAYANITVDELYGFVEPTDTVLPYVSEEVVAIEEAIKQQGIQLDEDRDDDSSI